MKTLFFSLFFFSVISNAQVLTINNDLENPIPNTHIHVSNLKGESQVFISDKNGEVKLPLLYIGEKSIVSISHISYSSFSDTMTFVKDTTIYLESADVSLKQVVVTAQFSPSLPEKAVQKIRIIDRKKINELAAVNLQNVLQYENSMRLSQDNILGSSVSIQGISGQNVKILIDGVPVIGRLNGNIDLSQINLNNIERIEIVEGPLSVNYGSDALAGTINLISKKIVNNSIHLNSYYESVGHYNADIEFAKKWRNHNFSVSVGRNFFDGWNSNERFQIIPKPIVADSNRFKNWKPKEQLFIKGQYIHEGEKLKIRTFSNFFHEIIQNRGIPRAPYFEIAFDDYFYTWRTNFGSDFNYRYNEKFKISGLLTYNDYKRIKNTFFKDLTTLDEILTENTSDQDTSKFHSWMSRLSVVQKFSNQITSEIGYDTQYQTAIGKRISTGYKTQGDYAFYTNTEWKPNEKITIRPGLRLTYNTSYKAPLIPSLHLRYHIKDWKIRASFAKGFRAPSVKELYFEFVDINHNILGNKDLLAETSSNYQVSALWSNEENYILKWGIDAFYNNLKQLITLAKNEDLYTYINIGNYKTLGSKTNLNWNLNWITINTGFSYIGRYNNISETSVVNPFSFATEYNSSFIINLNKLMKKFAHVDILHDANVAIFYKYTGDLPSFTINTNDNVQESVIEGYQLLDINFSKKLYDKKIKLTAGCKNIFDIQDVSMTGIVSGVHQSTTNSMSVGYGRSFFASLKLIL